MTQLSEVKGQVEAVKAEKEQLSKQLDGLKSDIKVWAETDLLWLRTLLCHIFLSFICGKLRNEMK